ncbi:hypothetical protein B0H13DRAFT_1861968 [Mycena leptocephala]|nr:hypothetical protein B0H13DRAFT_1861968 [Mycena leptocephala]
MPPHPTATQTRIKNVKTCFKTTAETLEMLANDLKIPLLEPICNTTQSLLKWMQTVKQNKNECADLMEKSNNLLDAITIVYLKSDTGTDLPPIVLKHIRRFTEFLAQLCKTLYRTLHKMHTFVKAQQKGSKIYTANLMMADIVEMQENA